MNGLVEHRRRITLGILRVSIGLCLAMLLAGVVLFLVHGGAAQPANPGGSLPYILDAVLHRGGMLHAGAFLVAGLLVLLFTPVARLIAGVYVSARARDGVYVLIGLVVLGLVLVGMILGGG
ncbi:MAG TPA: DUF1634 domain-containing protein [Gammaproteobacteria bacterium]|nr:DUF1634 domain-containing protein [Gammaproteobacteria bacterium]